MSDTDRYIRQTPLIGEEGQIKLADSHVVVIGVGALGTVAAELLVRSGINHITLIDRDIVETSNLQRQSLYIEDDVLTSKVLCAKEKLLAINKDVKIEIHAVNLSKRNISDCVPKNVDLILDCCDTMSLRWLINDYTRKHKIPWIFASAVGWQGMLQLILPDSNCLACNFPKEAQGETCAEAGVMAMTSHTIASLQSNLALRFLVGEKIEEFCGTLFSLDLQSLDIRKFKVKKKENCGPCKKEFMLLENEGDQEQIVRFCSSGQFQVHKTNSVDLNKLLMVVKKEFEFVHLDEVCLRFGPVTVFSDGRALIKSNSEAEAVSIYDKYVRN